MQALLLQAKNIGDYLIAALAAVRVQAERIRASRTGRIISWALLAALALTLWTLVTFRVAQRDAQRSFEEWQTRFADEYISMQEAKERGMPPDPKVELRKQENMAFAQLISGLKRYQYGNEDFITLGQCVKNRELNPAYPSTIVEVIRQANQWPGYSENNEVTESTYKKAESILDGIRAQEMQPCDSSLTIAEFGEHITLRNTMEYSRDTVTWRYGQ